METDNIKKMCSEENSPEEIDSNLISEINILPNELLAKIFAFSNKKYLVYTIALVCKRWNFVVKGMPCWRKAEVYPTPHAKKALKYLKWHSGNLDKLIFYGRKDLPALLGNVNTSGVRSLLMYGCLNDFDVVEKIVNGGLSFPYLQELHITCKKGEVKKFVRKLRSLSLKKLSVSSSGAVKTGDFKYFCLKHLVDVRFTHVEKFRSQDVELENGRLQKGLRFIRRSCKYLCVVLPDLNNSTVKVISEMQHLKELWICSSLYLTRTGLDLLAHLPNLTCLVMYDFIDPFTEEDLINFFKKARFRHILKNFTYYYINREVSDNTLDEISRICPKARLQFSNDSKNFARSLYFATGIPPSWEISKQPNEKKEGLYINLPKTLHDHFSLQREIL